MGRGKSIKKNESFQIIHNMKMLNVPKQQIAKSLDLNIKTVNKVLSGKPLTMLHDQRIQDNFEKLADKERSLLIGRGKKRKEMNSYIGANVKYIKTYQDKKGLTGNQIKRMQESKQTWYWKKLQEDIKKKYGRTVQLTIKDFIQFYQTLKGGK